MFDGLAPRVAAARLPRGGGRLPGPRRQRPPRHGLRVGAVPPRPRAADPPPRRGPGRVRGPLLRRRPGHGGGRGLPGARPLDREHRRPRSARRRRWCRPTEIPDAHPAVVRPHRPAPCSAPRRPWASLEEMAAYAEPQQPAPVAGLGPAPRPARRPSRSRAAGCGRPTRCSASASRASSTWRCSRSRCARARCPVLVLTGDQEDTWRELTDEELEARPAGSARGTRWCRAPATTSTSRIPTRRCATSRRSSPRSGRDAPSCCTTSAPRRRGSRGGRSAPDGCGRRPTCPATARRPPRATAPTTR